MVFSTPMSRLKSEQRQLLGRAAGDKGSRVAKPCVRFHFSQFNQLENVMNMWKSNASTMAMSQLQLVAVGRDGSSFQVGVLW